MGRDELGEIFRRYNVRIAYLFGSQRDRGIAFIDGESIKPEEGHDLDIGVVFNKLPLNRMNIYGELYADLSFFFEPFNIDLVFLQETDSLFQFEAIKGTLIYHDDEDFLDEYEETVMKKAEDMAYKKRDFEKDFLEAIRDGYFEVKRR
jgi:predicted nucleotidyltransferase